MTIKKSVFTDQSSIDKCVIVAGTDNDNYGHIDSFDASSVDDEEDENDYVRACLSPVIPLSFDAFFHVSFFQSEESDDEQANFVVR